MKNLILKNIEWDFHYDDIVESLNACESAEKLAEYFNITTEELNNLSPQEKEEKIVKFADSEWENDKGVSFFNYPSEIEVPDEVMESIIKNGLDESGLDNPDLIDFLNDSFLASWDYDYRCFANDFEVKEIVKDKDCFISPEETIVVVSFDNSCKTDDLPFRSQPFGEIFITSKMQQESENFDIESEEPLFNFLSDLTINFDKLGIFVPLSYRTDYGKKEFYLGEPNIYADSDKCFLAGFISVDKEKLKQTIGEITPENLLKAKKLINEELQELNDVINDKVFQLIEYDLDGNELDCSDVFIGSDFNENGMNEWLDIDKSKKLGNFENVEEAIQVANNLLLKNQTEKNI